MKALTVLILILASLNVVYAQGSEPCNRGAGGISHCQGSKFICNDGRVSGSKKTCDADTYGTKKPPQKNQKNQINQRKVKNSNAKQKRTLDR